MRQDSPLVTATDLRGRVIALNEGSNVHYSVLRALQNQRMSLNDVQCRYLAPDEALWRIRRGLD